MLLHTPISPSGYEVIFHALRHLYLAIPHRVSLMKDERSTWCLDLQMHFKIEVKEIMLCRWMPSCLRELRYGQRCGRGTNGCVSGAITYTFLTYVCCCFAGTSNVMHMWVSWTVFDRRFLFAPSVLLLGSLRAVHADWTECRVNGRIE